MSKFYKISSKSWKSKVIAENSWTLGCQRCFPAYSWSTENGYSVLTVEHGSAYADGKGQCRNHYSGGRFAFEDHPTASGSRAVRL